MNRKRLAWCRWQRPWLAAGACLLAVVAVAAHAQTVPISLCDFSPSESEFRDWNFMVDFRSVNNPGPDNTIYNGTLRSDGTYLLDTQSSGFNLASNVKLDLSESSLNTFNIAPSFKSFTGNSDFFFFIGLDVQGLGEIKLANMAFSAPVGWGFGRFKDVTPFSLVLSIQNELLRMGKLDEPLPDETLQHIANLISQKTPDTPISLLVSQIQETLQDSGLIMRGPLAAPSLLTIERIVQSRSFAKFCGWETSLGFELEGLTSNVLGLFTFKYAIAPGPRSQFILDSKLSFGNDIFNPGLGTFFLDVQASYTYRISDFLNSEGRYAFLRSSSRGSSPIDVQALNISLELNNLLPSLTAMIDLDWAMATGTQGWSRSINLNLVYEIF